MKITALLAILATSLAARANIITNADFESGGYSPFWTVKNSSSLGAMSVSNGANHTTGGTYALRVSGRTGSSGSQAGPAANITGGFTAQGSGRTWTTRAWVKLDAYASVRVMVQHFVNSVAQPPRIFAERVVLTPGVWVQVTGTQTLSWSGTLTQAQMYLEIEQLQRGGSGPPAAQVRFPDYWVDDISVDLDDDGDGLLNSEESADHSQTTVSFSDSADSDGDGIPDDFERKYPAALNPRNAADATLDFDHDGWTNIEEYIAGTDPTDAGSFPAPSDPQATLAARALHRYLIHVAATGRHLVGQMVGDVATDFAPYVDGLANLPGGGGRYPAVLGLAPEGFTTPLDFSTDAQTAAQYVAAGGIITLNWQMYNPWVKSDGTFGNGNYLGTATDNYRVDIPGLLATNGVGATTNSPASNLAARAALLDWCDQTATLLKQHVPGAPILMRPFHEMNGSWFWWGHRTREEYIGLWTLVRDRFVTYHGMHNLLWVCSASGDEHVPAVAFGSGTSVEYYYPGDSVVDVVGAHFYENFTSPFDVDRVWARHPKILAMPEFGSALSTRMTPGFDNRWVINAIRTRMPRVAYFTSWNSWTNHDDDDNNPLTPANNDDADPAHQDTPTHKYISIVENPYAAELLADPGVVTRDEVAFMPPASLGANAASSTGFTLAWPGVAGNTGYRIEVSATGAPDAWTTAATTAAGTGAATLGGFTPASARFFRIRTLYGTDDTLPSDAVSATTWTLFQQWKNDTLGDVNADNFADGDADGLATVLEYSLGANPFADSAAQRPVQGIVNVAGANYLTLTFRRRTGTSGVNGVTTIVEATGNLLAGTWQPDPVQFGVPVNNGDGTETVTFRDIIPLGGAASRFLRLRVSTPGLAATVVSEPVGFVSVNLAAPAVGSSTGKLIGVPFHRASVFLGSNVLAAANSLQSTAPGWVSGQFTSVVHFARLRSGVYSGRFFTITANTADTLTLAASNTTFGVGDTFEIFPAHTLGSLFGTSTPAFGLQTGSTESSADLVRCIVGGTWVSYFHNGSQWRTAADSTSQNNTVIPPDQGVFVVRRSPTSLDITLQGAVSVTAESSSITGTGQGVLGPRFPLPTTLASLGVQSCSGWRKARSASLADTVLVWNGGDWSVFYHNGASWRRAGASSAQDSTVIPAGEAVLIRRKDAASGSAEMTTIGLPFAYPTP